MVDNLKKSLLWLARLLGRDIRDERTGKTIGRALCLPLPWGTWFIGLPKGLQPVFLAEPVTRYTKHRLAFRTHEEPDYASLGHEEPAFQRSQLLWALIVHQSPKQVHGLLGYWEGLGYSREKILIVHAGDRLDFEELDFPNKVFVEDRDIRTVFHPMEKQSYGGAFREVASWLQGRDFKAIAFVEYDHLPLVPDWDERLCDRLHEERADLLCHHLQRIDGTNASHYLEHQSEPRFSNLWRECSVREDKRVFVDAVMTGSVWTRRAFEAVASRREPFPVYLEIYLPSLAHHLGFRVRGHGDQDRFVQVFPMEEPLARKWLEEGAWSLHQVKNLPTGSLT
jgi:hypothetical protein